MDFAHNLKQTRLTQKLSLQELSDRCGVSRSMLSKIERAEKNPTLQVACQIAEGLGVTLSQLIDEQEQSREAIVIPKGQRQMFRDTKTGFERQLLSPAFPSRGLEFLFNIIPPKQESGTFPPHRTGVTEYLVVAQGRLRAILGEQHYTLETGDSLYFEANIPHRFLNLAEEECQYYLIINSQQVKG